MKKIYIILFALVALASCNFLDKTPQATISPDSYFKNETDLRMFTDPLYANLLSCDFEEQSDHVVEKGKLSNIIRGGNARSVPGSGGGWSWGTLRRINTCLGNSYRCEDVKVREKYDAVCRFFRAMFYYQKVVRFGDVPWIDKEMASDSPDLYAARDSRELVMQKMIEDIDYAIEHLDVAVTTPYRVNKWTALALKADFCLFEGTFRKYHGLEIEGAKPYTYYLELAAEAAEEVITTGPYHLASDYRMLFAEDDADRGEFILAIRYSDSPAVRNNTCAYVLMPTQGCPGLTKKFVDSYLMKDGSRFTDKEGWATMPYLDEVANRDPRLGMTAILPGHKFIGGVTVVAPAYDCTSTGYQISKYVGDCTVPNFKRVTMAINDLPVYRLAEVYLNYVEAKAELEKLTQADLDMSLNLLRDRVQMPHLDMDAANADPDPYLCSEEYGYRNVNGANKGVILEIRRERAIELALEGKRIKDLFRWKEGLCLNQTLRGVYFPTLGEYDLTGDGVADICLYEGTKPATSNPDVVLLEVGTIENGVILNEGYVDSHVDVDRTGFNEARDYFYPIPSGERLVNNNLTQNPGWDDGLNF